MDTILQEREQHRAALAQALDRGELSALAKTLGISYDTLRGFARHRVESLRWESIEAVRRALEGRNKAA